MLRRKKGTGLLATYKIQRVSHLLLPDSPHRLHLRPETDTDFSHLNSAHSSWPPISPSFLFSPLAPSPCRRLEMNVFTGKAEEEARGVGVAKES